MKHASHRITHYFGSLLLIALFAGLTFAAESVPTMSKKEVKALIATASTPEDHHRLAAYFTQKAETMEAEAVEHDELSKVYFNNTGNDEMNRSWSATTAGY